MKIKKRIKLLILIALMFIFNINLDANETVKFSKCVDGDTIKVLLDETEIVVRLLAVDTPETKHPQKGVQKYGKEASLFTCDLIANAASIELEYDDNSDKFDKYSRHLAWVFVDGELLQEILIEKGYAKTAYLYDEYKYTEELKVKQLKAKESKIGIWEEYDNTKDIIYITLTIILLLVVFILSSKKDKIRIKKKAIKWVKKFSVEEIESTLKKK